MNNALLHADRVLAETGSSSPSSKIAGEDVDDGGEDVNEVVVVDESCRFAISVSSIACLFFLLMMMMIMDGMALIGIIIDKMSCVFSEKKYIFHIYIYIAMKERSSAVGRGDGPV